MARFLGDISSLNVAYIHLERDSRGVVFSWNTRPKRLPEYIEHAQLMRTVSSPASGALFWSARYACAMLVRRAHPKNMLEVSYEQLAHDPDAVIGAITRFIEGLGFADLGAAGNDVALDRYHSVGGNPIRFDRDIPSVKPDYEWRHQMRWRDRAVVTVLTTPFLIRHYRMIHDGEARSHCTG